MTFKDNLDNAFEKHIKQIAIQLNFQVYENYDQGMGALIKLKNKDLIIQLINDRGLINLEIGSIYGKDYFFDSELISSLIRLEQADQENLSKMRRKQIINNRLSLEQQIGLLNSYYFKLKEIFSKSNYKKTFEILNKIGRERFENML